MSADNRVNLGVKTFLYWHVIGQKHNRPANERRRRLHSPEHQVSARPEKLFLVVVWSVSFNVVTDETITLCLVLAQKTRVIQCTCVWMCAQVILYHHSIFQNHSETLFYQLNCRWSRSRISVRENVCNDSKNVKSHVFLDFEKHVKKRTYRFRGHLITPVFNTQLPSQYR